jgi:hypothetical protein
MNNLSDIFHELNELEYNIRQQEGEQYEVS